MDTSGSASQSLVGGQGEKGTNSFKTDIGSPLWRHTTQISQVAGGGSYYRKCNYCHSNKGKPFNSSYSQVNLHFMGPAGKGFGMCKGKNGTGMTSAEILPLVREHKVFDALINRSKKATIKVHPQRARCMLDQKKLLSRSILKDKDACTHKPIASSQHHSCKYMCQKKMRKKWEFQPAKEAHCTPHLKWSQETALMKLVHVASMQMGFLSTW